MSSRALLLIFPSPTIQVSVLGRAEASFPLKNPGLVTIPLALLVGIVVSLVAPEREAAERSEEVRRRVHLGPEAAGAWPRPAPASPRATARRRECDGDLRPDTRRAALC
jgi:cation/acetate symporter